MKHAIIIALLLVLAGCATTQYNPNSAPRPEAQETEQPQQPTVNVELVCSGLCPEYYENTLYPVLLPAVERGDVELEVTEMYMFAEPSDAAELVAVRCAYITDGLEAGVELGKETLKVAEGTREQMREIAQQENLSAQWKSCYSNQFQEVLATLKQEKQDALERGLNGDPTVVVNGEVFVGGLPAIVANATAAIQQHIT